jgi:hypothetical protein
MKAAHYSVISIVINCLQAAVLYASLIETGATKTTNGWK